MSDSLLRKISFHRQPGKSVEILENHEIKKLFDLNMYVIRIFIRFYTYSNNLQSL